MAKDWIAETLYSNGVLKNKLGIKDKKQLAATEYLISAERALLLLQMHLRVEKINDLHKIHYFMFSPLYDWAGQERWGDFAKGNTTFYPYQRFAFARQNIDNFLEDLPPKKPLQSITYAELLDRINFYHPFREGNGRSTKVFLQCLAAEHHQVIDYPYHNDAMIEAQNAADVKGLAKLIKLENTPDRAAAFERLILSNQKIKD
ncbi:MAG: Fic family protein [Lactobacillus sp.]|jgi:cell filamentation protein|nr:Fic family protein [Lactobacillus sp.]MCH3906358.1 Fic family protein [Lactobacillus sp.]MCH3990068.1 Fic family protein [Lactobacillus sp.]MCH4069218.1 Fic family protein [Lactobacillus sp.]MCI1303520.1 Fic family protein [Lactobacillus sp.]